MKTTFKLGRLLATALVILFIMTTSLAQDKTSTDLKPFKITIEKTDKGLKLTSIEGSEWLDLSLSFPNDSPQAIDEYGKTQLGKVSNDKNPKLADYLFTITRTKKGYVLAGIEGTVWTKLSFSLNKNEKHTIDEFGIAME